MEACTYCLQDKCDEKCPDKVLVGPKRDYAMASFGAGAYFALVGLGETLPAEKEDDPYFVLGFYSGIVKRNEYAGGARRRIRGEDDGLGDS